MTSFPPGSSLTRCYGHFSYRICYGLISSMIWYFDFYCLNGYSLMRYIDRTWFCWMTLRWLFQCIAWSVRPGTLLIQIVYSWQFTCFRVARPGWNIGFVFAVSISVRGRIIFFIISQTDSSAYYSWAYCQDEYRTFPNTFVSLLRTVAHFLF